MKKNHNRVNNNDRCTKIYKGGKKIRLLYEREREYEMTTVKKNDFDKVEWGEIRRVRNGIKDKRRKE